MMMTRGKDVGSFAVVSDAGFSPENAFRDVGKLDFDSSLMQAQTFTANRSRLTTLAVMNRVLNLRRSDEV